MKPVWVAVFTLSVLCCSSSYPQAASPQALPADQTPSDANAPTHADPLPEGVPVSLRLSPQLTEDELHQQLVGKQLYLRGLWLDDDLHFNYEGKLDGRSPKGSFTLCAVEIEKVHLTKHHVELEGLRYGLHFASEASWDNQATSFDRIRVTPKKKHLEIVIDRQAVVSPKEKKGHADKGDKAEKTGGASPDAADATETGADEKSPGTTNPAESAEHLRTALNKIFAPSLDARMIARMPDYWQFFYKAQMEHKSIEPTDASIVRPGPGIDGPRLVKNVVPASNDYAQHSEVAGVASYKVILGTDGKPLAISVFKPIGFGLDENAVEAIRQSTFTAALKEGKPVPSVIDLAVNFRIYSKRTQDTPAEAESADAAAISPVTGKTPLPGIYSTNQGH